MAKLRNLFHPKQQLAPKILLPQARQAEERQEGAMGVKYPKASKSAEIPPFLSVFKMNQRDGSFGWLEMYVLCSNPPRYLSIEPEFG